MEAALEALPDARMHYAVDELVERVRKDRLPLMSLLQAERYVAKDVCAECLSVAASLPRPDDARGGAS